jgi:hypothetical protein
MTREKFIKKWLSNKGYQYTEQNRDLMRNDLDEVINQALPQTNVSGSFKEWYLEFRSEIAKSFGVNYSISIASWTFSENHKHYYDKGLTPKEAVLEYASSKNYR